MTDPIHSEATQGDDAVRENDRKIALESNRPRLLDLFCGAGGAAMGYHRAGFDVVGVDIAPQPRYPFAFVQADALTYLERVSRADAHANMIKPGGGSFDAIHASPPCQAFTAYRRKGHGVGDGYPDLIAKVREELSGTDLPYIIENVWGASLHNPIVLCGSSFGLDVRRHRLFESKMPLMAVPCGHGIQTPRFPAATNRRLLSRSTVEVGVWRIPLETQQKAMGIDWMTLEELSEAVPPAYTEFIGHQLLAQMRQEVAA